MQIIVKNATWRRLAVFGLLAGGLIVLSAGQIITAAEEPLELDSVQLTLIEQIELPARDAGVLQQIHATEGATIEAGKPLGQIDDREARLVLARAEKEWQQAQQLATNDLKIRFARKSQEVAKAELQRSLDSIQQFPKSVSATELDRLKLAADRAVLETEQAEFDFQQLALNAAIKQNDVERAKLAVERRQLLAPWTGVVVQWKRHPGEWVEPGSAVVRLVRLHQLRAESFVPAAKLDARATGRPVTLVIDLPDQPAQRFPGKLVFVSPEVETVTGQVRIWAEIDNHDLRLRPGLRGRLKIEPR